MTVISQNESPNLAYIRSLLVWLTVERTAYGLILVLAAALRLAGLGQQPFAPGEAAQAWSAVAMLRGEWTLPASGASPLLLSLNWLTFALVQPAEALARVFPALAGTMLVLLPYALRRELGRTAALFSALLLALSASMTFWSRSATGESFTLLAGLGLVVCLAGLRRSQAGKSAGWNRWLAWAAAALALLLMGAPGSYSALILIAPLALLWLLGNRDRNGEAGQPRPGLSTPLLTFLALILLGSTAFFLNPGGLAALADLPAAWLHQFGQSQGYAWGWLWLEFLIGEPLLVATGLAGLAVALRRDRGQAPARPAFWLALGLWVLLGLALSALRAGRTPADAALVVLPLALLAGQAFAALAHSINRDEWSLDAAALLAGGLAIIASAGIWLANYAGPGRFEAQSVFLISAAGSLLLLGIVFLAYGLLFNHKLTLHIMLILLAMTLLFPALRHTMTTSHNRDGLRWGSLLHTVGASDGPNLTAFLARIANERGGDLRELPVALIVDPGGDVPALLRWYLRETGIQETAAGAFRPEGGSGADAAAGEVLVSMAGRTPSLAEDLSGQSFRLTQSWSPARLSGPLFWRWVLFDQFQELESQERAVIWSRLAPQ